MSSVYCPAPVKKRASSLRLTDCPMNPDSIAPMGIFLLGHRGGALLHRLDDVVIAGAAAQVALQLLADRLFVGVRMTRDEIDRAHHHAGRAEATLEAVAFLERVLHRMHRSIGRRDALDRHDVRALHLPCENVARLDRAAVDVDRACAALRGIAADVRARQGQRSAQKIGEQHARINIGAHRFAIDGQCKGNRHGTSSTVACRAGILDSGRGGKGRILRQPSEGNASTQRRGAPSKRRVDFYRLAMYCARFSMSVSESVLATLVMLPASLVRWRALKSLSCFL